LSKSRLCPGKPQKTLDNGGEKSQVSNDQNNQSIKSRKTRFFVIPAKAGIQPFKFVMEHPDSGFHRSDDFLRSHQTRKDTFSLCFIDYSRKSDIEKQGTSASEPELKTTQQHFKRNPQ